MTWTNRRLFTADERSTARQKAAAMYEAGHTIRCASEAIGWSWTTTRELIAEAEVPFRPRGSQCTAAH